MKKFIAGFALAAVLFTALPIGAAIEEFILYRADYNILANGEVYNDPELPALNYKGYTYIPLRNIAKLLGVQLDWNATLNQAEITRAAITSIEVTPTPEPTSSPAHTPVPTITPTPAPKPTPVPMPSPIVFKKTEDGLDIVQYDGKEYVSFDEIRKTCKKYGYTLNERNMNSTTFESIWYLANKNGDIVLDNIQMPSIYRMSSVEVSYYINVILPLFK
jgi:hypothetical protein